MPIPFTEILVTKNRYIDIEVERLRSTRLTGGVSERYSYHGSDLRWNEGDLPQHERMDQRELPTCVGRFGRQVRAWSRRCARSLQQVVVLHGQAQSLEQRTFQPHPDLLPEHGLREERTHFSGYVAYHGTTVSCRECRGRERREGRYREPSLSSS